MNSTVFPTLNASLPVDADNSTMQGLPMSTRLTIGVLSGVAVFALIVIIIVLVCVLIQSKKAKVTEKSETPNAGIPGSQMTPYPGNFRSPNDIPPGGAYTPDGQLREYDNWAYTAAADEQGYYPDVISDLHQNNSVENKDIQWTTISLRAHDNYDYERYGRIPRAKLYERKEELTS